MIKGRYNDNECKSRANHEKIKKIMIIDFDNAGIITDIKNVKKLVGFKTYYSD